MRIFLSALIIAVLAGCATYSEKEYVTWQNADHRVWPPVVEGQAFPVQYLWDAN
jgi:hypothetical protein